MITKLDFFQTQPASTSVSQLGIHLSWAEDHLPRLPERGEAAILDFFQPLDTIYALIQSFEASTHRPDLSPEQARLETIRQAMIGRRGPFLGKLGRTRRVRQLRPAEVSRETHPWWFIDKGLLFSLGCAGAAASWAQFCSSWSFCSIQC